MILKSLEQEYENENWSTENYYLIILSYSILVSLGSSNDIVVFK